MSQAQIQLLVFKIVLIVAVVASVHFVAAYSRWQKWWRHSPGITIVAETVALALAWTPLIMASFITLGRLANEIATWVLLFFVACGPAILEWRTEVMRRQKNDNKLIRELQKARAAAGQCVACGQHLPTGTEAVVLTEEPDSPAAT